MKADCHIHMVLDGVDWKKAIARHQEKPDLIWIRQTLQQYLGQGITYLRDGGDRWGVGEAARSIGASMGITYRTPLAPLCRKGYYGGFIGCTYEDLRDYATLVAEHRQRGGDFVKLMLSGIMDFNQYGVLIGNPLPTGWIEELIHIAHEEGFSVMAHVNGAREVEAAAIAGVDSVEHGAFLDREALCAMKERGTVWVPTLSTIGNLRGKGRFQDTVVERILESAMENVRSFAQMGGILAPGTDAGAWAVPHGVDTEYQIFTQALGDNATQLLKQGIEKIREKF